MLEDLTIAVTGGSGFIGYNLIMKLLENNANIILLDRDPSRPQFSNLVKESRIQIIKYDLTKPKPDLPDRIKDVDCLVHLAAFVPRSNSPNDDDLEKSIEVNIKGTCNLMSFFSRIDKIIFASTLEVYGIPKKTPINEEHPTNPLSYYGVSKLAAEKYLLAFSRRSGIRVIALRFSSVYGPGETFNRAIPNFIKSVVKGEPPVIYGDGSDVRDYVYIDDAVNAIISAILRDVEGVYNIASGKGYSIREIAEMIIQISGKNLRPVFKPSEKAPTKFIFDISKAQKELAYHPQTDIRDGLYKEYEWYKEILR